MDQVKMKSLEIESYLEVKLSTKLKKPIHKPREEIDPALEKLFRIKAALKHRFQK